MMRGPARYSLRALFPSPFLSLRHGLKERGGKTGLETGGETGLETGKALKRRTEENIPRGALRHRTTLHCQQ